MSARKAKEAYLRKHGGLRTSKEDMSASERTSASGYSSTDEPSSPRIATKKKENSNDPISPSWSQKRKQNYLSRATGERTPREPEIPEQLAVSLAAVSFAAKLKAGVNKNKDGGDDKPLSWRQKRAESYKLRHGVPKTPMEELAVSTSAVLFAARLKKRASAAKEGGAAGGVVLMTGDGAQATDAAVAKAKRENNGELSWTQKRKEAFLRKYGRQAKDEPEHTDVAVSAVAFAAKLKARQAAAKAASGAGGAAGGGGEEVVHLS